MNSLFEFATKFRYVLALFFLSVLIAVSIQVRGSTIDMMPEFQPPFVEIQTEALGLSAEEIEALITVPIEVDLMNGVSWVKDIQSRSMPGLSSIVLTFEKGTDLFRARQMVQERMTQAHALPNVSKPPIMMQPKSSASRVLQIAMSSDKYSLIDLSVAARWNLRPRLLGVPGVANVSIWGQRKRQLQVQVDPERLRGAGVSLEQVIKTSGNALWYSPLTYLNASTPGAGGFIDTPNQRLSVQHIQPISTPDQLSRVTVDGTNQTLGDVATIVQNHQPVIGDAVVNGGKGLILVIEKFPWADTVDVTRGVESTLEALKLGLPDITIDATVFRPASYLEESSSSIVLAVFLGFVVAAICIFLLSRSWQQTVIVSVSAATSFAISASLLKYFGQGFDLVSITGLLAATGVVYADSMLSSSGSREEHWANGHGWSGLLAHAGFGRSRNIAIFAAIAILLLAAPLLFFEGLEGAMAMSLFTAYAIAVVTSLIVSLVLPPALVAILPSGAPASDTAEPLPQEQAKTDQPQSGVATLPIIAAAFALAFFGLFAFSVMDRTLAPVFKERDILLKLTGTTGTSNDSMYRLAAQAVADVRKLPGIAAAGAHIGRAVVSDKVENVNAAELWINLDKSADYEATLKSIRDVAYSYPGVEPQVLNYSGEQLFEQSGDSDKDLTVRVFGYKSETLNDLAGKVQSMLTGFPSLSDVEIIKPVEEAVIQIKVDLEKAKGYGLKPGDVRRNSAILLAGLEVGSLFEDQKVFDVIVWGTPDVRHSVTSVQELLIEAPGNQLVRLADVADIKVAAMPSVIDRDAASRFIDIRAKVVSANAAGLSKEISGKLKELNFPLEFHAEVLGGFVELEAISSRLRNSIIIAIIGVFLIFQAAFGSWKLAGGAIGALLAALSGGVFMAAATGGLTLGAVAGLLAGAAMAVPYMMMLLHRYQSAERAGLSNHTTRTFGDFKRVFPATAGPVFVALAFLLPALLIGGGPGLEIIQPMIIVAIGSAITTLIVGLLVVPAIYQKLGAGAALENDKLFADQTIHSDEGEASHAA